RPLLRDDRAQIPKRNEERAGASVAGGGGVVLRVAEGDAVEAKGHGHHTTCTCPHGNGTGRRSTRSDRVADQFFRLRPRGMIDLQSFNWVRGSGPWRRGCGDCIHMETVPEPSCAAPTSVLRAP